MTAVVAPFVCERAPLDQASGIAWGMGDARIFVGTRAHQLVCFDARTGELLQGIGVGEPIDAVGPLADGVVLDLRSNGRAALRWRRRAYDGRLEEPSLDATHAAMAPRSAPPAGAPEGRALWTPSQSGAYSAAIHDGRLEIWPAAGTDGWHLGWLRARFAGARPPPLSPADEEPLRREVSASFAAGQLDHALNVASRLILSGDPMIADHVARALVCQARGDQAGHYFELTTATRLAQRSGGRSPAADMLQQYGAGVKVALELMFASGVIDAEDWRLRTAALRYHNVAFALLREGSFGEALSLWADSLWIRPTALAWYYAAVTFVGLREPGMAHWCFERLDRAPRDEVQALLDGLDREAVARLRAEARAGAEAAPPPAPTAGASPPAPPAAAPPAAVGGGAKAGATPTRDAVTSKVAAAHEGRFEGISATMQARLEALEGKVTKRAFEGVQLAAHADAKVPFAAQWKHARFHGKTNRFKIEGLVFESGTPAADARKNLRVATSNGGRYAYVLHAKELAHPDPPVYWHDLQADPASVGKAPGTHGQAAPSLTAFLALLEYDPSAPPSS